MTSIHQRLDQAAGEKAVHLIAAERWTDAVAVCRTLVADSVQSPDALHLLALALSGAGERTESMRLLKVSIALAPNKWEFHNNASFIWERGGRPEMGLRSLARSHALGNNEPNFWRSFGDALKRGDQLQQSRLAYARGVDVQSERTRMRRNRAIPAFHFTRHNAPLTGAELDSCRDLLRRIRVLVEARDAGCVGEGKEQALSQPSLNWSAARQQTIELDGAILNPKSSYELLDRGDERVLNNLRLYSHAFSGYQLATLAFAIGLPWIREPLPFDVDRLVIEPRTHEVCASVGEYKTLCSHALASFEPLSFPAKFGEIGWMVGNSIVNYDLVYYLGHLADLVTSGIIGALQAKSRERPVVVLEIGGGFGGLAYLIRRVLPNSLYIVVDLPESLAFSTLYLSHVMPSDASLLVDGMQQQIMLREWVAARSKQGFAFVPNFSVGELEATGLGIDLAINTLSLDEMSFDQADDYAMRIARMLLPGSYFYEVNIRLRDLFERYFVDATPDTPFTRRRKQIQHNLYDPLGYWQSRAPKRQ